MSTGVSNNLLKLEYHAGFQKLSNELWNLDATANVAFYSILTQKSEIILNDYDVLPQAGIDVL